MNVTWKTKLVEMGPSPAPNVNVTRRVDCACQLAHVDGNVTKSSCGAFWFATFHAPAGPQQQQITPQSDAKVVAAAEAFDKASQDEETRLRAAAEKWVAGVAAVLALLGVAGTVTGGKLFETMSYPGKGFVIGLTLLAVAAALAAVVGSYRAAYGWPRQVDIDNDDKLMAWYEGRENRLKDAADRLRIAVTLAGVAIGLLTLAAAVGWLTPANTAKPTVSVTLDDDSTRCGELLAPKQNGGLRLRRSDNGDAVEVPTSRVVSIEAVKAC